MNLCSMRYNPTYEPRESQHRTPPTGPQNQGIQRLKSVEAGQATQSGFLRRRRTCIRCPDPGRVARIYCLERNIQFERKSSSTDPLSEGHEDGLQRGAALFES
jgi:hypothetical protein